MKILNVGKRIKHYREENGLTQQQLADKIGVTCEMVSRYERGVNDPYNRINVLAKVLNVDLAELLQKNNNTNFSKEIPLFTKIPKNFEFYIENTNFFYTCPEWIYKKDKKSFAIDIDLVNGEENGVLYVSPRTKPKDDCFVILNKNNYLKLERFQDHKEIIGVLLAKEIRIF